ncbi:oxidoreductase [Sphingomonas sp. SRS2]|uniref:oxidoreductase n=1 Tax=Sphingomonas sp. SRS2 TaxID=133190 RepID=UPI0006184C4B|nr:oxidoreductase [Sphingomonas sp. SRS2]KKC27519.1 oxidoreductase [Sphingomonas sp. SRS2]
MSGFNYLMLSGAGVAVLLFIVLAFVLTRRSHGGGGFEAPDLRPAPERARSSAPAAAIPAAPLPPYRPWRLIAREIANPDSAGGPLYRLKLEPEEAMPGWRAGAVANVYCGPPSDVLDSGRAATAPVGDYMVGSLPDEGAVEIVVRLYTQHAPEQASRSRWLCQEVETGQQVALALCDNPDFVPPPEQVPLVLIGNATGLAGLQAHIKARPPGTRNWLIFGDRNSSGDRALAAEITEWVSSGHLERCDLVFPGEGREQRHVTDQIEDAKNPLLDWVLAGSAIYVCGSRLMGEDVHSSLISLLGEDVVEEMAEQGLYRQAVY